MQILHEDNHLLVVVKPAGLVTQGAAPGEDSLVTQVRDYLKRKYHKPGNVYVGVVSRLDATVSGVTVLARTSKAADRLTRAFRDREASKTYWGIVSGSPPPTAELEDWLIKDDRQQRVVVTSNQTPGAKAALLRFRTLGKTPGGHWLEVELVTGRKHQIRVQLGSRGWPILGDAKYGSKSSWPLGIALHARRLEIVHPVQKVPLVFEAPVPPAWHAQGIR